MERCPEYKNGNAKEGSLFGGKNKLIFCNAKVCPYNKELSTTLYDENITICSSKAWLSNDEFNNPDTNKKSNKSLIPHQSDLKGGNLTKVMYFQF